MTFSIATHLADTTTLHNGVKMPWFGLGVYKAQAGAEVEQAVLAALRHGYRSIDTAKLYANEDSVGKALKASEMAREDVFITTKVWNTEQGYESTLRAFADSRSKLGLDYVDLYLIHWPVKGKYKDTWRALEQLYKDGQIRAIGVSNFQVHHLEDLMATSEIMPMVNQVEFHPRLTQNTLREFCAANHIQMEAWSPLMRGNELLTHPVISSIAKDHGKTPAQVILRWDLQHHVITIPKSVHEDRISENADIFDFSLSDEAMNQIDQLNNNQRIGPDPDNFEF
jgi:diketogulonate reductase-like aldo/keto reductase